MPSLKLDQLGIVLLAGTSLGSTAVMIRLGTAQLPALMFITLRFTFSVLAFVITLLALRRSLPRDAVIWRDIVLSGIANTAVPVVVFTFALQYISSGVFGILLALYPLLTALSAHLIWQHERLTPLRAAGLGLAFGGTLLLILTGTTGLAGGADYRGHLLALVGVVMSTLGLLYMRARLRDVDAIVVTAGQTAITLPLVAPFALMGGLLPLSAITWQTWLAVLFAALMGSYLGYMLLLVLTQRYGATSGALPGYVMPVVSALLGALILGEMITPPLVAGAVLVLAGVVLVSQ